MAGLDKMYDARGFIKNYFAKQIRGLLESPLKSGSKFLMTHYF